MPFLDSHAATYERIVTVDNRCGVLRTYWEGKLDANTAQREHSAFVSARAF